MRKRIVDLGIIIIIGIVGFMFFNTNAKEPVKGDLKCPDVLDKNVKCEAKLDSNGRVTSVELVYEEEDITVKKIVTKKSVLGKYDVEFEVKGKNDSQIKTQLPAYVMVVVDMSATIKNKIDPMQEAVRAFGKTLIPNNDGSSIFNLGLIQFASSAVVTQNFTNKNFDNLVFAEYASKGLGKKSHVEKAYEEAYRLFQTIPNNTNKYLFIFGDGRYWSARDTDTKKIISDSETLKNSGVTIFGARYEGSSVNSSLGKYNVALNLGCVQGEPYGNCDEAIMKKIVSRYYPPTSDWNTLFKEIANEIKGLAEEKSEAYYADLKDTVGNDFNITGDNGSYKEFDVGELTLTAKKFGPFEIEIDSMASKGWHETNENVKFSYYTEGEKKHEYTIDSNPEVYWVPENKSFQSCTDTITVDTNSEDGLENYNYFSKNCVEGYMDGNTYKQGYTASIIVNNLKEGTKNFALVKAIGFPSTIKLSTNIKCTYQFNTKEYLKDYQELEKDIQNETDIKEQYELKVKKNEMDSILTNYLKLSSETDLEDYKQRFLDQAATLSVQYESSNEIDTVNFVNSDTSKLSISPCESLKVENINGTSIATNKVCKASFEKEMQLPLVCLSMHNGEKSECLSESSVDGGNKFYIKSNATKGQIKINILKAGYRGNLDFILDKDEKGNPACQFTNSDTELTFRQIDLSDPFLKKSNPTRGIGRNYLNEKFDFEKIIHSDTWSQEYKPLYDYSMSKTNISNITKNTYEDRVNSYLGRFCHFTNDNKYICDFTRNISENGTDNGETWFFKSEFN